MLFDNNSFIDFKIIEVKESASLQTLDFLLELPTLRNNNLFEKKVLRFKDAIVYIKKEMPINGYPSIQEVKLINSHKHTYKSYSGTIETSKQKVEIVTNAGSRFVEFSEAELLDV